MLILFLTSSSFSLEMLERERLLLKNVPSMLYGLKLSLTFIVMLWPMCSDKFSFAMLCDIVTKSLKSSLNSAPRNKRSYPTVLKHSFLQIESFLIQSGFFPSEKEIDKFISDWHVNYTINLASHGHVLVSTIGKSHFF